MHPHLHDIDDAVWITHPAWADDTPPLQAPVLRWSGSIGSPVRSARLTVAGLGVWEARINGAPSSADVLEPGVSETRTRVATVSHDVTSLLREGVNELVVELGEGPSHVREVEGRYTKFAGLRVAPRARVALVVETADGRTERHVSGPGWGAMLGPTTLSHWYGGEDYDARLEPAGWHTAAGTPDAAWEPVAVVGGPQDGPRPWERQAPPMRVVDVVEERTRLPLTDGATVDLGRNLAGRQVLRLGPGFPAGARVEMFPAEYVHDDGRVDQSSTGRTIMDTYTAGGGTASGGTATWRPRFCYHGFRYLQLRVVAADGTVLPVDDVHVSAEQIMTDDPVVGRFTTSDATLQGVYDLVVRAAESNLYSVPTDCPHREKLGWLEQLDQVFEPVSARFDVSAHYADMITHMQDSQTPDGLIPDIAPELVVFEDGFRDDVSWGGVVWHLPRHLHRQYGDLAPARHAWDAGVRYLDYVERSAGGGLLDHGLGDWITLDDSTPRPLVATYGWVRMLDSATEVAEALGRDADAARFRGRAGELREMLEAEYVTGGGEDLVVGSGSQASLALLVDLGALGGTRHEAAGQQLVARIHDAGDRITVGEIGLAALQRVLVERGEHELLRTVYTRLDVPSYGTMLDAGETTLHEHWTGRATDGSANHFMLGYVAHWLTGSVAGLRQDVGSVAWDRALVAPAPVAGVESAATHHDSPAGRYSVAWRRDEEGLVLRVVVPAAGSARLVLPDGFVPATTDEVSVSDLGPGTHVRRLVERPRVD